MGLNNSSIRLHPEELFNSLTHGFGALLSLAGSVFLVFLGATQGTAWHVFSFCVYGASLVLLYSSSTFYHLLTPSRIKNLLRIFDHMCIFLLIAGTYTPFALVNLRDGIGWALFFLVWGMALAGLVFKILFRNRFPAVLVLLYLAMGWLAVFTLNPIIAGLPPGALWLLFLGGCAYTGGIVFFLWERFPYNHTVWHLFVLTGSIFHYFAVLFYVVPQ